jgi:alkylation response protein AidB-like acyl-CoA dehydrogenase
VQDITSVEVLARTFAERDKVDPESYPAANMSDLASAHLLGAPLPPSLGGVGWNLPLTVQALETVAASSPSTALLWAMPLGLAGILGLGGSVAPPRYRSRWEAQIERVASDYRKGRIYAACNSEKGAGGSLSATKTRADLGSDGQIRLTGEKILGSHGRYAAVFFSTAKISSGDVAGDVEFFLVRSDTPGVDIRSDWNGFGMRSTESVSVHYQQALAEDQLGFPRFIATVQPLQYVFCLFAAIPLGCARGMLHAMGNPAPASPAMRLRLNEALMRYEALRAYLLETAERWRPGCGPAYAARVLRTKTYVSQASTQLCAELFALSGGSHYRRGDALSGLLADSFAGTALRPPLPLALDLLSQDFSVPQDEVLDPPV